MDTKGAPTATEPARGEAGATTSTDPVSDQVREPSPAALAPVQRQPSISFHPSANPPPISPRAQRSQMDSDEQADENTAIVQHGKKGARNYNTQDTSSSALHDQSTSSDDDGGSIDATGEAHEPRRRRRGNNTDEATRRNAEEAPSSPKWWQRTLEKYGSIELENKGSVARDHLALERTYLAWLRTSLSFASIGIAITQLFRLNTTINDTNSDREKHRLRNVGKPLGATFIGIGIVVLLLGFHRYFESQHYVILGKFPASRGSVLAVTGIAFALIVASLVVILTVAPGAIES